jgi:hypothetical protein
MTQTLGSNIMEVEIVEGLMELATFFVKTLAPLVVGFIAGYVYRGSISRLRKRERRQQRVPRD